MNNQIIVRTRASVKGEAGSGTVEIHLGNTLDKSEHLFYTYSGTVSYIQQVAPAPHLITSRQHTRIT
jgi:hypothetical protein